MEEAVKQTNEKEGVEKMVWILDFADFGSRVSDADSKETSRATLNILQNHYPERLGVGILVNPPFYFNLLWMFISPFIDSVTRNKVKFVSGSKEVVSTELQKFVSLDQLHPDYVLS